MHQIIFRGKPVLDAFFVEVEQGESGDNHMYSEWV
jgi:hypothetical protein